MKNVRTDSVEFPGGQSISFFAAQQVSNKVTKTIMRSETSEHSTFPKQIQNKLKYVEDAALLKQN
jgi:hypothetical protein